MGKSATYKRQECTGGVLVEVVSQSRDVVVGDHVYFFSEASLHTAKLFETRYVGNTELP